MSRILVAVGSEEALARKQVESVESLDVDPEDASITILHTFTGQSSEAAEIVDTPNPSETRSSSRHPAATVAAEAFRESGYDVSFADSTGDPVEGIIGVADDMDADAVVIGLGKRSRVGKLLFGSDTQSLLLNAARPVLVVPSKAPGR